MKQKSVLDPLTNMPRNFDYTSSTSGSQALQMRFLNGISLPVSTGRVIKGEKDEPFRVALVDETGKVVSTGAGAAATVEIVVLEGGCNDDEVGNWSSDEFNSKVVDNWNGKKVLQGNTFLNLKEGIGYVDKISFTQNSNWKTSTNFRLGARFVNAVFVKEAKTESFVVSDKRKDMYKNHDIPDLHDEVWRLRMIGRKGPVANSLAQDKIKTVGDFIVRLFLNRQCLVEIFDRAKQGKNLESSVEHALTCPTKLKYSSNHEQKPEVVFSVSGEVLGLYLHGQFLSRNKLSETQKEDAKKLVISAFKNWGDVMHVDEDQLVADCSKPTVHGFAKTEMVTPCVNTLVTTFDKNIYQGHLDSIKHSLFSNMFSDEQHPNPDLLPESSRKQYHEIRSGFEIELFGTKTVKKKRFCRRWRMLVLVVTFTRPLPRRSLDDIRSHKKPRLS